MPYVLMDFLNPLTGSYEKFISSFVNEVQFGIIIVNSDNFLYIKIAIETDQ